MVIISKGEEVGVAWGGGRRKLASFIKHTKCFLFERNPHKIIITLQNHETKSEHHCAMHNEHVPKY